MRCINAIESLTCPIFPIQALRTPLLRALLTPVLKIVLWLSQAVDASGESTKPHL
jgi:hypothetical protein